MIRFALVLTILFALALVGHPAIAGCPSQAAGDNDKKPSCCGSSDASCCAAGSKSAVLAAPAASPSPCGSAIASNAGLCERGQEAVAKATRAALEALPAMTFRVGDRSTSCPAEAEKLMTDGAPVRFQIGEALFSDKAEAEASLAEAIDRWVVRYASVSSPESKTSGTCCQSQEQPVEETCSGGERGILRVAGRRFECPEEAARVARIATDAMANVKLLYRVGDETFSCGESAAARTGCAGEVLFVVGDGEPTPCRLTASRELARRRIEAVETALLLAGIPGRTDA